MPEPFAASFDRSESQTSRRARVTAAAETLALQGAIMGWNRYVGDARWAVVTPASLGRNLSSPWVLDRDAYFVNQLGHPQQGTFPFTAARSAGLGFWESAAFPFAASALWEIAGETDRAAINDQITTTIAGIVLGEIVFRASEWTRANGRDVWRNLLATLVAPMTALDTAAGAGRRPAPRALRLEAGAGVLSTVRAPRGDAVSPGAAPVLRLALTHGVPGAPETSIERPFDHFDAVVAFAPTPDPIMTIRARGLVAAGEFGRNERGGGLAGVWLSFDLDSPGARRVSTSAVGLGATGRWEIGRRLVAEGTAIASAVVLGAAGVVEPAPGSARDYRFGPGAQGVAEARLVADGRFTLGASLRPYLILAATTPRGSELVVNGEASAQVRLLGHHALGVSAMRFLRWFSKETGSSARQTGAQATVTWTFVLDPPPIGPNVSDGAAVPPGS